MRLLIDAIPTKPGGGLTVLLGLLRGWKQLAAPLEVIVLVSDRQTEAEITATGAVAAIEHVELGRLTSAAFVWQNTLLGRWARRARAAAVIGNNHYLYNLSCPQIVHHHNLWRFVTPDLGVHRPPGLTNHIRDRNARVALRWATANVFVSDFLRHQAERLVPDTAGRNYVVRNGLDDEVIDRARTLPDGAYNPTQLVAIQSANPHKDNTTMVEALAELVGLAPEVPWHLKVAGSAGRAGWAEVQDLAARRGVAERITWCGFCQLPQLDHMLRESLCLLATSVLEAGPLPVIEAMARRCVPVAARIPANEEFVGPAGILVTPRQPRAFAEAILALHRQPARRAELVARGLEWIEQFRWNRCAARFYEIVEAAVRQHPQGRPEVGQGERSGGVAV